MRDTPVHSVTHAVLNDGWWGIVLPFIYKSMWVFLRKAQKIWKFYSLKTRLIYFCRQGNYFLYVVKRGKQYSKLECLLPHIRKFEGRRQWIKNIKLIGFLFLASFYPLVYFVCNGLYICYINSESRENIKETQVRVYRNKVKMLIIKFSCSQNFDLFTLFLYIHISFIYSQTLHYEYLFL